MDRPYELGDNEIHLAFETDDYEAAHKRHEEMGIYFVNDPNGYWLEILPAKRWKCTDGYGEVQKGTEKNG